MKCIVVAVDESLWSELKNEARKAGTTPEMVAVLALNNLAGCVTPYGRYAERAKEDQEVCQPLGR